MFKNKKNFIITLSCATLVLFALSFGTFKASSENGNYPKVVIKKMMEKVNKKIQIDEEESHSIAGIESIIIKTKIVDIKIVATSNDQLRIHNKFSYYPANKEKDNKGSIVKREGKKLIIRYPGSTGKLWVQFDKKDSKDSTIKIPDTFKGKITINATSGDIEVKKINIKTLESKMVSGDIEIHNSTIGEIIASSTSGDIKLRKTTANLTAKSVSGDIKVRRSSGNMSIATTSGDFKTSRLNLTKNINVKTVSGDVEINGKHASNSTITFRTVSGDLDFDEAKDHSGRKFHKIMGDGSTTLSVTTVSGDFELKI